MWDIKEAKDYFYMETAHAEISEIVLAETKDSYFDSINCFRIVTTDPSMAMGESTILTREPSRSLVSTIGAASLTIRFPAATID